MREVLRTVIRANRVQGGFRLGLVGSLLACALLTGPARASAQVTGTYLYTLSNFTGRVAYDWPRVYVDEDRDEIYVLYQSLVRIFNNVGMETFRFGDDLGLGQLIDVAVDERGDIILLSYLDSHPLVTRCNFRGVPSGRIDITNVPADVRFGPGRMMYRRGALYFVSLTEGRVIITGPDGAFRQHIDLSALLKADENKDVGEVEIGGISVDKDGNIFFTVPVVFRAYKLTPTGQLTSFGRAGSTPGRFGVIAGIVADSRGNVLVADKLKCVVIVFDKNFNVVTEFGRRGTRPDNLIIPEQLAVDSRDRLYVTQGRRRGVSVFALTE